LLCDRERDFRGTETKQDGLVAHCTLDGFDVHLENKCLVSDFALFLKPLDPMMG